PREFGKLLGPPRPLTGDFLPDCHKASGLPPQSSNAYPNSRGDMISGSIADVTAEHGEYRLGNQRVAPFNGPEHARQQHDNTGLSATNAGQRGESGSGRERREHTQGGDNPSVVGGDSDEALRAFNGELALLNARHRVLLRGLQ